MALSILDGNQSATTLSTILSSGQHITAHTVVSLGTQAITDMRGAVSGSVVSISNFPATQTIAGTVTANIGGIASSVTLPVRLNAEKFGEAPSGQDTLVVCNSSGMLLVDANFGGSSVLGFDGNAFVQVKPVSGSSVTIGNSVTISSLPALVAGTAQIGSVTASISGTVPISISSVTVGNSVTIGSLPAISGTVTANGGDFTGDNTPPTRAVQIGFTEINGSGDFVAVNNDNRPFPVQVLSSTVTANITTASLFNALENYALNFNDSLPVAIKDVPNGIALPTDLVDSGSNSRFVNGALPISGTVTANSSNGSLTTQFGSVVTANTAFATSAVTNANRKYLLIQNITTASNVITVGIGFTPTTTQGIQLFAGAGLTFEGTYIPTGAVNLLSSVTASCYTILEA